MGGEESKENQQKEQIPTEQIDPNDQNYYFLEQLQKVLLKSKRQISYYWIDPRVYNAENQKYFKQFKSHFKIESFTSLEGLKYELDEIHNHELIKVVTAASLPDDDYRHMQNQAKIQQIFLFCGNEEKAKLLSNNFNKIKGFGLKCDQVVKVLKKAEESDNLDVDPTNVIFMIEEDRKLLNKYKLNYNCITKSTCREKAKKDFLEVSNQLFPEKAEQIKKFEDTYHIGLSNDQARNQILNWVFGDTFVWNMIQKLPSTTVDPKRLAYLRLAFGDLYEAIFIKHRSLTKKPKEIYIVAQLNDLQIQKLNLEDSLGNFLIFTSFVKGFTVKKDAINEMKTSAKKFLFIVQFEKFQIEESLDFGLWISENKDIKQNVIFNIYNFFTIEEYETGSREVMINYGSLARAYKIRDDKSLKLRLKVNEEVLLRNYDYLIDILKKDDSQALILQLSGYFKESLEVYDKRVEFMKKNNSKHEKLNHYILLRGDAFRLNEEFEEAEKEYKSLKETPQKMQAWVHLLELYLKKQDDKKAYEVVEYLQESNNLKKLKQKCPEQAFKAHNLIALTWIKQGKVKQALRKYKNLREEIALYYEDRFQGIPLVHDIFRNMATCQAKLNNPKEAINLLQSTRNWQLVCEGESAGVAVTEGLMKTVYQNLGDFEAARQTEATMQQMQSSLGINQKRYINQSKVLVGLNAQKNIQQSSVMVNMNPSQKIEQSSVVVNLNPNVNNSVVDVNMNQQQPPQNINNSVVDVKMNPMANVNNSVVDVKVDEAKQQNFMQSKVEVDVNAQQNMKKPINVEESKVDIQL